MSWLREMPELTVVVPCSSSQADEDAKGEASDLLCERLASTGFGPLPIWMPDQRVNSHVILRGFLSSRRTD